MAQIEKLIKNTIRVGLEKPLRVLHVTDAHLAFADGRDNERKRELAVRRHASFAQRGGEHYEDTYFEWLDYGRENCDVTVDTGDVMDFTSEVLLEKLREATFVRGGANMIFAAGNHEYSRYVGEAFEDDAYRMQSFSRVQASVPVNLDFAARVIGGVNFVSLDNGYYNVTERQLALLKVETERPYPIVLCMHTPLWHPAYLEDMEKRLTDAGKPLNPLEPLYLCGTPFDVVRRYAGDRSVQQFTTPTTHAFYDFVTTHPAFRLVLAGHTHENFECTFESGLVQLNTDIACRSAREITLE